MNTGGPAFPIHGSGMFHEPITKTQGMTLLDWMAGQALEKASKGSEKTAEDIAKRAYYIASAMLTEKARREADHSPDAGKMVEINRELVEALGAIVLRAEDPALCDDTDALLIKARAALAKAKGVA